MGQRPQRGAHRRLLPGASPSKQRIGAGESRHSRSSWRFGERGAERRDRFAESRPGRARSRPSGLRRRSPASPRGSPAPAWSRLNRVRPLSNKGVSGEFRYLGSPAPRMRPLKAMHPAARVADREHQPAAEAVVGLLARPRARSSRPGLDQLVIAELLERGLELAARIGREAEAELAPSRVRRCRALQIVARRAAFDRRRAARRTIRRRLHHLVRGRRALRLLLRARVRRRHLHPRLRRPAP